MTGNQPEKALFAIKGAGEYLARNGMRITILRALDRKRFAGYAGKRDAKSLANTVWHGDGKSFEHIALDIVGLWRENPAAPDFRPTWRPRAGATGIMRDERQTYEIKPDGLGRWTDGVSTWVADGRVLIGGAPTLSHTCDLIREATPEDLGTIGAPTTDRDGAYSERMVPRDLGGSDDAAMCALETRPYLVPENIARCPVCGTGPCEKTGQKIGAATARIEIEKDATMQAPKTVRGDSGKSLHLIAWDGLLELAKVNGDDEPSIDRDRGTEALVSHLVDCAIRAQKAANLWFKEIGRKTDDRKHLAKECNALKAERDQAIKDRDQARTVITDQEVSLKRADEELNDVSQKYANLAEELKAVDGQRLLAIQERDRARAEIKKLAEAYDTTRYLYNKTRQDLDQERMRHGAAREELADLRKVARSAPMQPGESRIGMASHREGMTAEQQIRLELAKSDRAGHATGDGQRLDDWIINGSKPAQKPVDAP